MKTVVVDSNIIIKNHFEFGSGMLGSIFARAKNGLLNIVIPEVVLKECIINFRETVARFVDDSFKSKKPVNLYTLGFDRDDIDRKAALTVDLFENEIRSLETDEHVKFENAINPKSTERLFQEYFSDGGLFGSRKSGKGSREFVDALILFLAEEISNRDDSQVYLLSNDNWSFSNLSEAGRVRVFKNCEELITHLNHTEKGQLFDAQKELEGKVECIRFELEKQLLTGNQYPILVGDLDRSLSAERKYGNILEVCGLDVVATSIAENEIRFFAKTAVKYDRIGQMNTSNPILFSWQFEQPKRGLLGWVWVELKFVKTKNELVILNKENICIEDDLDRTLSWLC